LEVQLVAESIIPQNILKKLPRMAREELPTLSQEIQQKFLEIYQKRAKKLWFAYILCLLYGTHYVYLEETGTGIWFWQEIVKIMEATNPKYVGLALDPGHIISGGGTTDTIVSIIETYKDRLVYFHLKDAIKPGVSELDPPPSSYIWAQRFREIGHGEIIWPLVFLAIKRAGYSGWMTVELDPAAQNGLVPALSAAISKAYIDAYIKPLL
jgi:sugar phosphate isomerase/epimerase